MEHDFLVTNEVSWYYGTCTIYWEANRRTIARWKGRKPTLSLPPDLSGLEINGDSCVFVTITVVVKIYLDEFSDKVDRTKLIEQDILLKYHAPIDLKPNLYPLTKQTIIDDMIRDIRQQGLVEFSTSTWVTTVNLAKKKKDGRPCYALTIDVSVTSLSPTHTQCATSISWYEKWERRKYSSFWNQNQVPGSTKMRENIQLSERVGSYTNLESCLLN